MCLGKRNRNIQPHSVRELYHVALRDGLTKHAFGCFVEWWTHWFPFFEFLTLGKQ